MKIENLDFGISNSDVEISGIKIKTDHNEQRFQNLDFGILQSVMEISKKKNDSSNSPKIGEIGKFGLREMGKKEIGSLNSLKKKTKFENFNSGVSKV